jgi:hypothetical protein
MCVNTSRVVGDRDKHRDVERAQRQKLVLHPGHHHDRQRVGEKRSGIEPPAILITSKEPAFSSAMRPSIGRPTGPPFPNTHVRSSRDTGEQRRLDPRIQSRQRNFGATAFPMRRPPRKISRQPDNVERVGYEPKSTPARADPEASHVQSPGRHGPSTMGTSRSDAIDQMCQIPVLPAIPR